MDSSYDLGNPASCRLHNLPKPQAAGRLNQQPRLRQADISKATQAREVISFRDHWKRASGADPKMLIMDQKVTTQDVLGELDQRRVSSRPCALSRSLMKHIGSLAPADP